MIPQDTPIATVLVVDDSAVNLMLLGMMMPDMDGYGVLARLHEDARTRDIPAQIELEQARDRLQEHNAFLEAEVAHRMRAEEEVRSLNADLERRAGGWRCPTAIWRHSATPSPTICASRSGRSTPTPASCGSRNRSASRLKATDCSGASRSTPSG